MIIGLTGGIASGKSVVSGLLVERGAMVIDADKIGHEAYAPGSGCYDAVVHAFGREIVAEDGSIDRRALGGKVFGDMAQRRRLEGIVWPWMRETMQARFTKLRVDGEPIVVLEAAVLIEADWVPLVDQVWVVVVSPDVARERIMTRNGLTAEQADQRIAAQLTNAERVKHAHVTIENNGSLEELERRVDQAWRGLTTAAGRNL